MKVKPSVKIPPAIQEVIEEMTRSGSIWPLWAISVRAGFSLSYFSVFSYTAAAAKEEYQRHVDALRSNGASDAPYSTLPCRYPGRGLRCNSCGSENYKAVESRPASKGRMRRRRECLDCQNRFTTYELLEVDLATAAMSPNAQDRTIRLLKFHLRCANRLMAELSSNVSSEEELETLDETEEELIDLEETKS